MQHEKSILERLKAVEERIIELEQLMGTPSKPFPVPETGGELDETPHAEAPADSEETAARPKQPEPFLTATPESIAAVRGDLAVGALAMPRKVVDGKLHLTALEPFDKAVLDKIEKECGMEIVLDSGEMSDIIEALSFYYEDVRSPKPAAGVAEKADDETVSDPAAESTSEGSSDEDELAAKVAEMVAELDSDKPAA